jgi:hypothetical protein
MVVAHHPMQPHVAHAAILFFIYFWHWPQERGAGAAAAVEEL